MGQWKLSPSDLTFLWDECKRCFYLKVRHDFRRPSAPFPAIFGLIDQKMKDIYLGHSTRRISPDLPEGKAIMSGRWVTSAPIIHSVSGNSAFILGIFDTVVQFDDGSFGVVDFKTTTVKSDHVNFYSRQLHAYAYALKHPMPGKLHLHPVTRLGLLCFDPREMSEQPDGGLNLMGPATWLECPLDEVSFVAFIDEVLTLLTLPEAPEAGTDCAYCSYRDASRNTGF